MGKNVPLYIFYNVFDKRNLYLLPFEIFMKKLHVVYSRVRPWIMDPEHRTTELILPKFGASASNFQTLVREKKPEGKTTLANHVPHI